MQYKFCHQLKNSLFFANGDILHCCSSTENAAPKFKINYNGEHFDKNLIIEEKQAAAQKSKGKIIPFAACKDCHQYEKREWDNDFRIKDISISHWTACNCNCFYCYTAKNKTFFNTKQPYKLLPILEDIKDIIDFNGIVRFIGGDIAMLDEFEDIVDFFLKNGCKNFYIPTSGIKYVSTVANLLKQGIAHVIISTDSATEASYKKIKQVNCFDSVKQNIIKYNEAANEGNSIFELKYIIIPNINDSKEEIKKWLDMCTSINVNNIAIDFETNFLKDKPTEIPAHIPDLVKYIHKKAEDNNMNICNFTYLSQLLFGLKNGLYKLKGKNNV